MDIENLTLKQIREIQALALPASLPKSNGPHPMLGRRCLIRTYSAGVHIGDIDYVDGMECRLKKRTSPMEVGGRRALAFCGRE